MIDGELDPGDRVRPRAQHRRRHRRTRGRPSTSPSPTATASWWRRPTPTTPTADPTFLVSDIPLDEGPSELEIDQPGIYFGEELVRLRHHQHERRSEIDFQDDEGNQVPTEYYGRRRRRHRVVRPARPRSPCASATSTRCSPATSQTTAAMLLQRDVRDRVQALAPFLDVRQRPVPGGDRRPDAVGASTPTRRPTATPTPSGRSPTASRTATSTIGSTTSATR